MSKIIVKKELEDAISKRIFAVEQFNLVQESTFNVNISFYERLTLIAGGTISLSLTFLSTLLDTNDLALDRYKYLFLSGLGALLITMVLSLLYVLISNKARWYSHKAFLGISVSEEEKATSAAIETGILIPEKINTKDELDKIATDLRGEADKVSTKSDRFSKIQSLMGFLSPLFFILGIGSLTLYFVIFVY